MKKVVIAFIAWRLFLFVPLIISSYFIQTRKGFEYTTFLHFSSQNLLSNFLIYPWANFDGIYYLYIAGSGYTVDNAGFFPLFPALIKLLSFSSPNFSFNEFIIGFILSSLFFLLSLMFLYRLLSLDYTAKIALSTVIVILVFPTSFFFAAIYPESLFLLLTVLTFYFARKGNWLISSLFAVLLTATRIVGIAIFPALLFEFYIQNKTLISKKIIPILFVPAGLIFYSWFNLTSFRTPLQFIKAQGALHNSRSVEQIILLPQTLIRYLRILSELRFNQFEWWVAMLEFASFIFAAVLLYLAWKKKIRMSYIVFSLFAFLIPISTGTFSGLPRYVLILFPIFIALALVKNRYVKITYAVISLILLTILFMLFSKGYYVS